MPQRVLRLYLMMVLLAISCLGHIFTDRIIVSEIQMIKQYFTTKRISRVTGFICRGKTEISLLMKEISNAGIQSNFIDAQCDGDFLHRTMSRLSDPREKRPLGMLVDATCPHASLFLDLAYQHKAFDSMHFWLFLHDHLGLGDEKEEEPRKMDLALNTYALKEINKTFSNVQMFVDSEVTFVIKRKSTYGYELHAYEVYRVGKGASLIVTPLSLHGNNLEMNIPHCQLRKTLGQLVEVEHGVLTQTNDTKCIIINTPRDVQPTSLRRSNFQGTTLTAGTVITEPLLFTDMHDLRLSHIDTWTKINYILVEEMAQDLNFKLHIRQFNNWGYQTNGSFDGVVGALQRLELDLGATGMLFKEDRLMVMGYIGDTYHFRASILFRQPSLASITNIFLQPFSTNVWLCALFMFAVSIVALTVEINVEGKYQKKSNGGKRRFSKLKANTCPCGEVVMMVVGAACQQGFYSPPSSLSARITFLALWMASLFLFTSYAANVVALLQTPSHLVMTLGDLLKVPMEIGIQDVIYNHVYFRETTDPLAKELYHKKIEPYHERAYYNAVEGMHKVQKGLFAFQVEHAVGYKIISESFTVEEKCGLGAVRLIRSPLLGIPIVRDSPYKEILSQKLRHLREVGVLDRTWKQWVPQKPSCTNSHRSASRQFVSIGLEELRSSFSLLWSGAVASLSLLLFEILVHRHVKQRKRRIRFRN